MTISFPYTFNVPISAFEYEKSALLFRATENHLLNSWGMIFDKDVLDKYVIIVHGTREQKTFLFSSTGTNNDKYYFRHDPYLIAISRDLI
jgi:hypothetical protein